MQIDRSRFLLLTATIAGGGCGSGQASPQGAPVVAAPVVALPAESTAEKNEPRAASPAKPDVIAESEGDPIAALGGGAKAGGEGDDDVSMCEEGGAPPKGCGTLRAPGPQCESFLDTKGMCSKLARGLKPRVAEKAVDCLLAKSGKQSICDFRVGSECAMSAVRKACIEPSTQSTCAPVVRACSGNLSMKDCQSLLSAVESKHRRSMVSCMTEGCSIDYCMYDIE
jgi:hypothetical protein